MKLDKRTISVIILSYNEEKNLEDSVMSVLKALCGKFKDYEILVSDGGSTDKTLEIADKLALKNKKIKVIRNKNIGLGYSYLVGMKRALMNYCTMFPGDNENIGFYFSKTLEMIGEADIIIPYTMNPEVRSPSRRFISTFFVLILNWLFDLNLRYYNGPAVYKTETLKKLRIISKDFAYNSEILIRLIKTGSSYKEVGIKINPTKKTAIFKIKNIINILKTLMFFLYNLRIRKKY